VTLPHAPPPDRLTARCVAGHPLGLILTFLVGVPPTLLACSTSARRRSRPGPASYVGRPAIAGSWVPWGVVWWSRWSGRGRTSADHAVVWPLSCVIRHRIWCAAARHSDAVGGLGYGALAS